MRRYKLPAQNAVLTAAIANSIFRIPSGTAYRLCLWELLIGSRADGANAAAASVRRETAFTSGGAAITAIPNDNEDPASAATTASTGATGTVYVGLTGTTVVLPLSFNQRATYRYTWDPVSLAKFDNAANAGAILVVDATSSGFAVDAAPEFSE